MTVGTIIHRDRAKQLRDFSGMRYGSITPTDIDAFIEYKNKCYVIVEAKTGDVEIKRGQELALVRLCDDLQRTKPTLLVIASHNTPTDEDVNFALCDVRKYRFNGTWHDKCNKNVRKLVEGFLNKFGNQPPTSGEGEG